ncbi:MAG: magnesium-transporting ATPase (P-type), partial [Lentisphaeria bacterium]
GDPMEGALLVPGLKAGLDIEVEAKQYPRTDLIPFESEPRFMATVHHSHTGNAFVFLKVHLNVCWKYALSRELPIMMTPFIAITG